MLIVQMEFVVCPFVYEEPNGSYPFANRLNGLNGLNRLAPPSKPLTGWYYEVVKNTALWYKMF